MRRATNFNFTGARAPLMKVGLSTLRALGHGLEAPIHWRTSCLRALGHGPGASNSLANVVLESFEHGFAGSTSLANVVLESFGAWPWRLQIIGERRT